MCCLQIAFSGVEAEKGFFYSFNEAVEKVHSFAHPAVNQNKYQDRSKGQYFGEVNGALQTASLAFQAKLAEYGMICSMSRKGNCWDNAPTESWFGSFKNERVYGERFETRDEVIAMAFEYIEVFYNRKRLHSTLG